MRKAEFQSNTSIGGQFEAKASEVLRPKNTLASVNQTQAASPNFKGALRFTQIVNTVVYSLQLIILDTRAQCVRLHRRRVQVLPALADRPSQ